MGVETWEGAIEAAQTAENGGAEVVETPESPTAETVEAQPETPAEEVAEPSGDEEVEVEAGKAETEDASDEEEGADPPELQNLPSKSAQRRAARREYLASLKQENETLARDAELGRMYLDPTIPAARLNERELELSPHRYAEKVKDILTHHGDEYLENRYGLPIAEVDAAIEARKNAPAQEFNPEAEEGYDPYADALVPESVKAQLREAEALKKTVGELTEKVGSFEGKINEVETKEQERERLETEKQVRAIENGVFEAVFPVMHEAIKEYGLQDVEGDDDFTLGLKEAGREILISNVDLVFSKSEENKKAVSRVREFAKVQERENAMREVDPLKVRSRGAAEEVRQMRKLSSILDAIETHAKAKQQKLQSRGKGPPMPALPAAAGDTIPRTVIQTWDDAIAASQAGG